MLSNSLLKVGARGCRATSILGSILLLGGLAAACGGEPLDGEDAAGEPVANDGGFIINGQIDNGHQAVVAVLANNSACTGTIIHVDAAQGIGHVLTAGHCGTPVEIRQGTNYLSPSAVYSVIGSQNHPNYDPQSQLFDFKMVRFVGASGNTPVIPAMSPAEDNLQSGTQIRHVGYGKSGPAPGTDNTQRRQILGTLSGVNSTHIFYNQPNGGPCSGDSGGPQLTLGTERVAGVTSYGDQNCAVQGASGRVSGVYDTFIVPYINNAPTGPLTCDQCTQSATSGQGACSSQVNACFNNNDCTALLDCFDGCGNNNTCLQGCVNDHPTGWGLYQDIFTCVCDVGCVDECAGEAFCNSTSGPTTTTTTSSNAASSGSGESSSGTGGAGSGGSSGDGWNSGTVEDRDYNGYALDACTCRSVAPAHNGRAGWLALLGLAGLGVAFGRRRRRA